VRGGLANFGIGFQTFKDHVIFERSEVLTQMGKPYGVFTPYKNAWLQKVNDFYLKSYPVGKYIKALAARPKAYQLPVPSLADIGFEATNLSSLHVPTGSPGGLALFEDFFDRMDKYDETRNFHQRPQLLGRAFALWHRIHSPAGLYRLQAHVGGLNRRRDLVV
jgi:deoxyribodipyrimidine photo-lyase